MYICLFNYFILRNSIFQHFLQTCLWTQIVCLSVRLAISRAPNLVLLLGLQCNFYVIEIFYRMFRNIIAECCFYRSLLWYKKCFRYIKIYRKKTFPVHLICYYIQYIMRLIFITELDHNMLLRDINKSHLKYTCSDAQQR